MCVSLTRIPAFAFSLLIACLILLAGCVKFGELSYTRPSNIEPGKFNALYNSRYPEVFPISVAPVSMEVSVAASADSTTYLFCPFPCPLPLIPWIPGIVSSWIDPPEYEPDSKLWIEFWLIPKNGQFSFDPGKVTVQTSDEKQFVAAGLEGPGILHERQVNQQSDIAPLSHFCSLPLDLGSSSIFGQVPDHEVIIAKPICLRLAFRISVTPAIPYLLKIDGISIDGGRVSVPPIQFQRASRKEIWRIF